MDMDFTSDEYRLDDLQIKGYKLLQNKNQFCFGTDAVLLADFAEKLCKKRNKVIELCCGNGAISLLMYARNDTLNITGVEIQRDVALLANHNKEINGIGESLNFINEDLNKLDTTHSNVYDMVVVNPPYTPPMCGLTSPDGNKSLSRQELTADFDGITQTAKRLLKTKGKFVFIHKANRLGEIINTLKKYGFEIKVLRSVQSKRNSDAKLILVCASKDGGSWCDIKPPLVIYNDDGTHSDEIYEIYYSHGCEGI